jgi:hypothetical protein
MTDPTLKESRDTRSAAAVRPAVRGDTILQ